MIFRDDYGDGYFKSITFDFGVGIIIADCLLKKDLCIEFTKEKINPLKLLFNLNAPITLLGSDIEHRLTRLESLMFSPATSESQTLKFTKDKPTTFLCIHINRKVFEEKLEQFIGDMSVDLETLFRDLNGINKFYYKSFYTLEISELIEEIKSCDLSDFMQSVFLEGKTYEILTLFLQQFTEKRNEPDDLKLLRKSTITKIEAAVDIIKKELDIRISVNALAKRVGLNRNTLQAGFKQLFSTSVNEYMRDHKIERAKVLLENSDLNITEITYKIGINSEAISQNYLKNATD
ncbi:AraC family transcriptional regulator [Lacinutrix neustonica]|uniref:AraC family transcriptional regulator n=2 Tax=Lacinutrix neustonica TaxID=2980107 RepID=A0A9E8MZR6_9FLAO|nr:helix-turn-helix domain-containing protein [Lacinutrix neustonica]WAC03254.1 AraC family transcriptional regulator [Lacinutrix neustonica]